MKNKIAHALGGLAIGFACYALFLSAYVLFGMPLHQMAYWLFPVPNSAVASSPYTQFLMQFQLLWLTHRAELIAVLFGLPIPLGFSVLAWRVAGKRPIAGVRRWQVQLVFAVVSLVALLFIVNLISLILKFQLF